MGIEHVGIGADFMAQIVASGAEPACQASSLMPDGTSFADAVPGLAGPADYPALVRAMEARGYAGAELDAILNGNLLRLIAGALAATARRIGSGCASRASPTTDLSDRRSRGRQPTSQDQGG